MSLSLHATQFLTTSLSEVLGMLIRDEGELKTSVGGHPHRGSGSETKVALALSTAVPSYWESTASRHGYFPEAHCVCEGC